MTENKSHEEASRIIPQGITSLPSLTPISWATRADTLMAATLRGCVQPIFFSSRVNPASYKYCGIWVVFPDPVSPSMIMIYKNKLNNKGSLSYLTAVGCHFVGPFIILTALMHSTVAAGRDKQYV
jgi:hypothetical protein